MRIPKVGKRQVCHYNIIYKFCVKTSLIYSKALNKILLKITLFFPLFIRSSKSTSLISIILKYHSTIRLLYLIIGPTQQAA